MRLVILARLLVDELDHKCRVNSFTINHSANNSIVSEINSLFCKYSSQNEIFYLFYEDKEVFITLVLASEMASGTPELPGDIETFANVRGGIMRKYGAASQPDTARFWDKTDQVKLRCKMD